MKLKNYYMIAAIAAFGVASTQAAMVAHYTFDNASNVGENTGSAATTWNSFGAAQNTSAPKFGTAAAVFPAGAWDNSFNVGADLSSFSISLHIRGASVAWKDYISIGTDNNVVFVLEENGSKGVSNYNIGNVGGVTGGAGGSTAVDVTDGSWHHLGLTVGGNVATLYIDGVERSSGTYTGSGAISAFQIGSRFGDGSRSFTGDIDDVAVYNETLSESQMNWLSSNVAISSPVPEPSSTALLGLGGLALIMHRRK